MIVGTAGHIDHGKTALVRALTGVETDRLKEEKARGITIELGFAYWPRPNGPVIGFVDVPGHERFVGTMLVGAHGIDLVLLVIAANDGIMPQTREHLEILDLLGLTQGLVVLSKADLVDADTLAQRELEIIEALAGTTLAGAEVVPVSVVTGQGIAELTSRLDRAAERAIRRDAGRGFRLAVDRSFSLAGAGTVVTGAVLDGRITVGETVTVSPTGLTARVRALHAGNSPADQAVAGDRVALNLAGPDVTREAIRRGDVVLAPSLHAPATRLDVRLRAFAAWPDQGMTVRLHHAATEVRARVVHLGDPPEPGAILDVQLVLDRPLAVCARDRFVLRDVSGRRTLGGGIVLDPHPPYRRRRSSERAAIRNAWAIPDDAACLGRLLDQPPCVIALPTFLADRGLPTDAAPALTRSLDLATLRVERVDYVATHQRLETLTEQTTALLAAWHLDHPDLPGMPVNQARERVTRGLAAPVFRAIVAWMRDGGHIVAGGGWLRLPAHSVTLAPADMALWDQVRPLLLGEARFRPPRVRDLSHTLAVDETTLRGVMRRLRRASMLDEIAVDHYFPRATTIEMIGLARELSAERPDGWFNAAALRDRLGNGRKVAIQILEFLDRFGVTIRRGDLRRLNPRRPDLFETASERQERA
jgi:selenocysteine-specific elongation factor